MTRVGAVGDAPPRRRARVLVLALCCAVGLACSGNEEAVRAAAAEPHAIADHEDPVCGMLVREQSAPRAQLVHRDGSRFFFCSIGDMLVHLAAPSPHGRVEAVFVEVMAEDEAPLESHPGEHPWTAAGDAHYVVGVERRGIMGEPVLVYRDAASAGRVAAGHAGARVLGFTELVAWWQALQAR